MHESESPVGSVVAQFVAPRWRQFAGGVGFLVVAVFVQRIPALVVGVSVDALLADSQAFALPLMPQSLLPAATGAQAAVTVGVLGAAVLAESALTWYGSLVYEEAALRTRHEIRTAAFDAAATLPVWYHDDRAGGDVLSVVNDDVDNLGDLFAGARDGVLYGGGLVSAFAFMLLLKWQLAVLLLAVPVALVVTGRAYARLLEPRYDAVRESVGSVNSQVRDAVRGLATVKAYTGEATERERVAAASRRCGTPTGFSSSRTGASPNAARTAISSTRPARTPPCGTFRSATPRPRARPTTDGGKPAVYTRSRATHTRWTLRSRNYKNAPRRARTRSNPPPACCWRRTSTPTA